MQFRYRTTAAGILLLAAVACTSCSSQTTPSDTQVSTTATAVTPPMASSSPSAPTTSSSTSTAPPTPAPAQSTSAQPPATATTATDGAPAVTIAGTWAGTYQSSKFSDTQGTFTVTFTQDLSAIAGTIMVSSQCVDQGTVTGQLTGDTITFGAVKAAETVAFDGTIQADSMSGNYQSGPACGDDVGTWSATRE